MGFSGVIVPGKHSAQTSPQMFRELLKSFREKHFFGFENLYQANTDDLPTYALELRSGPIHKLVIDYGGQSVSMPPEVASLEDKVDSVTGSSRWTKGTAGIVPLLVAEHFNFHSIDALHLMEASARSSDAKTFEQLVAHGVPLRDNSEGLLLYSAAVGGNTHILSVVLGRCSGITATELTEALSWSASTGNAAAMNILLTRGADPNLATSGDSPMIAATKACQNKATKMLLDGHPNLKERYEGYPLNMLPTGYFGGLDAAACIDTLQLLKAAGIDPKATDNHGNTALHITTEPLIAQWLLSEGLAINARNSLGQTPLFTSSKRSVVEFLLSHGADPDLTDNEGRTALEVKDRAFK